MRKEEKEILKLTAKEILKTIFDVPVKMLLPFVSGSDLRSIEEYYQERDNDRFHFRNKIHYLKQQGLINVFVENKKRYIELTPKGILRLQKDQFEDLRIGRPKKWDGKFRMVIFDIPEKDRALRDGIRKKLNNVGFAQLQKSVFVYPFECKEEIDLICNFYPVEGFLKYLIADIIQGEEDIIQHFLNVKILSESDIATKKRCSRRSSS